MCHSCILFTHKTLVLSHAICTLVSQEIGYFPQKCIAVVKVHSSCFTVKLLSLKCHLRSGWKRCNGYVRLTRRWEKERDGREDLRGGDEGVSPRSGKNVCWYPVTNGLVSLPGLLPELPSPAAKLSHGRSERVMIVYLDLCLYVVFCFAGYVFGWFSCSCSFLDCVCL